MLIHDDILPVHCIMIPWRGQSIIRALIGYAGSTPVADHFNNITHRHLISVDRLILMEGKVYPIFKMMSVSALVVEP